MDNFGNQIRKLRKDKHFTLRSLAEKSNLSYSFIASLEKGRYNPSRESIYALAKPLDADVNELLMLAGFLPDHSVDIEQQLVRKDTPNTFELESIMDIPVTFQNEQLTEAEKIALISFLQTMTALKRS